MTEQHAMTIKFMDARVLQDLDAGGRGEGLTKQEVTVTVHQIATDATTAQAFYRMYAGQVMRVVEIVITCPVLEQVAKNVERVRVFVDTVHEADEVIGRGCARMPQVKVGNEEAVTFPIPGVRHGEVCRP